MSNKNMMTGPVTFTGTVKDPWVNGKANKHKLNKVKYVKVDGHSLSLPYHGPHPYGYTGTFHNVGRIAVDGPASE